MSSPPGAPQPDLELAIITYNRAEALDRTLAELHASPFAGFPLTVLDNASPDATPEVCARWRERFADMRVIRHRVNIGVVPNWLRAIELSRGRYTWVLADDDDFDFSDCGDLLDAVRAGDVDVIAPGAPGREDWPVGRTSMRALFAAGHRVAFVLSFLPGLIFRTSLFDSDTVDEAYAELRTAYAVFPFLRRQFERDASVLVTRREIVRRRGESVPGGSHFYFFVRWVWAAHVLREPTLVKQTIYHSEPTKLRWWRRLFGELLFERARYPERLPGEYVEVLRGLIGVQRVGLALMAPVLVTPIRLVDAALRLAAARGARRTR